MSKHDLNASTTNILSHNLAPTLRPICDLVPNPRNARKHSRKQIRKLVIIIKEFGWTIPVLIDENGMIIAGHGRVEAAKALGLTEVPTVCIRGLSPTQIRALALADNKIAEEAGWDAEILRLEFFELLDSKFEIEATGFDYAEIDQIMEAPAAADKPSIGELELPDLTGPPQTRPGDIWRLGDHLLMCADARHEVSYRALMADELAQMVFTDPPYNVPIEGHVMGKGRIKHREFAMAVGEMTAKQFIAFLEAFIAMLVKFSGDGSIHYLCMDWRHLMDLLTAAQRHYAELKNICVWAKTNAGMGSFYRSQHELVAVYKNGSGKHINNFGLGESGRHRSNIWSYAGMNALTRERMDELKLHPTVKPVAMVADAIRDCSKRGGIVLDPFCGSGTTILAAEVTGRRCRAIELDPLFVDVAIRRWQRVTGEVAVRQDGVTFIAA